jgi:hypothetical protein
VAAIAHLEPDAVARGHRQGDVGVVPGSVRTSQGCEDGRNTRQRAGSDDPRRGGGGSGQPRHRVERFEPFQLDIRNSDENAEQERGYLELLEEQRVLGVVISPVDERNDTLQWLRERGTAVVLLRRRRHDYCSVRVDDVTGGQLATEHLLDLGHRRLAYVTGPLSIDQYRDRLKAYAGPCGIAGRPRTPAGSSRSARWARRRRAGRHAAARAASGRHRRHLRQRPAAERGPARYRARPPRGHVPAGAGGPCDDATGGRTPDPA